MLKDFKNLIRLHHQKDKVELDKAMEIMADKYANKFSDKSLNFFLFAVLALTLLISISSVIISGYVQAFVINLVLVSFGIQIPQWLICSVFIAISCLLGILKFYIKSDN